MERRKQRTPKSRSNFLTSLRESVLLAMMKMKEGVCDENRVENTDVSNQSGHHSVYSALHSCSFLLRFSIWIGIRLAGPPGANRADILRPQCADSFRAGLGGQSCRIADDGGVADFGSLLSPQLSQILISALL